ncbi:outer membrane or secreted lipoprotein [Brachybacterium sp. P6-10-X1]|uniref:OBAP family protein n=1 Tax=Brachybacterium sp. P6-10-X1 TaxID=1903186 RepID=UPI000971A23D|nr:OBAP family protein [Brachybacterium sp. P6-10-X1]APX32343.1 outer membrane or secreted lipoprotein [Brachybacterium sp. P6-10-X1]
MGPGVPKRAAPIRSAGRRKGPRFSALQLGAKALQSTAPLHGFDAYLVGFHPAKSDPSMQMEAHHFCKVVNDDLIQCILFDGNDEAAHLIGHEYIVSEALFTTLPDEEKDYWHPHNHEILSGELVAPGLPEIAERELMRELVNSSGKTWHTWHTGRHDSGGGDSLPMGEPMLMWSFNRDGECDPALQSARDEALDVDTAAVRRGRQELSDRAHPQRGVDALKDRFGDTAPVPGVLDDGAVDGE